jgi:diamine N-acetyltransferase
VAEGTQPFLLTGGRAALGTLDPAHAPLLSAWMNDPEVRRGLAFRGVVDLPAEERWIQEMSEAGAERHPQTVGFAVHDTEDREPVGVCSLEQIDHAFGRCEFGIFLGRRRGSGIGTDATRLALDWAFHMLNLRNVMLETYDFNAAAQRAYERAGFRVIGRRRDSVLALGRRWDVILMDATADEFDSPGLAKLLPDA